MASKTNFSPGYDVNIFVIQPDDSFKCKLCKQILKEPRTCTKGTCLFCRECLLKAVTARNGCPCCKTLLTAKQIIKHIHVEKTIEEMLTYCVSCDEVSDKTTEECCNWTGELKHRARHYETECGFAKADCPNTNCTAILQKRTLAAHLLKCEHAAVACNYCRIKFLTKDIDKHLQNCEKYRIPCANGCAAESLPVEQMHAHMKNDCQYQLLDCPLHHLNMCLGCAGKVRRGDISTHVLSMCNAKLLDLAHFKTLTEQTNYLTNQNNLSYAAHQIVETKCEALNTSVTVLGTKVDALTKTQQLLVGQNSKYADDLSQLHTTVSKAQKVAADEIKLISVCGDEDHRAIKRLTESNNALTEQLHVAKEQYSGLGKQNIDLATEMASLRKDITISNKKYDTLVSVLNSLVDQNDLKYVSTANRTESTVDGRLNNTHSGTAAQAAPTATAYAFTAHHTDTSSNYGAFANTARDVRDTRDGARDARDRRETDYSSNRTDNSKRYTADTAYTTSAAYSGQDVKRSRTADAVIGQERR